MLNSTAVLQLNCCAKLNICASISSTNSEQIVKETIDSFKMQGRTIVVIAHRLSIIANADTILVMENDQIVESGNHKELLALKNK